MDFHDRFIFQHQWARVGVRHHHGILVSLASLHSETSCGVGEILDLIPLIEWLPQTGFTLLQLLPLNDTGNEASPYMALSAYALHPLYISIHALPGVDRLQSYVNYRKCLHEKLYANHSTFSYHTVLSEKIRILREYMCQEEGIALLSSSAFQDFLKREEKWLLPYILFRSLKELDASKAWWHFSECATRPSSASKLLHERKDVQKEAYFWAALQFIAFGQWEQVRKTSTKAGVSLMGDLPILVNKDSADVWWNPELFALDLSVGAPPDMYAQEGQNWGFPLYKWEKHKAHNYTWFQERLAVQEKLYDLFRIDHVIGLFRLWAIPPGKKSKEGFFIPSSSSEWMQQAEELFSVIQQATHMLPIGEDLGDIPSEARMLMRAIGVPGVKVLRWERNWGRSDHQQPAPFYHPSCFSPESMTTISTHDSSLFEEWWTEDPITTQRFCHDMSIPWTPTLTPESRLLVMKLCHSARSLFHINLLQEYLAFIPVLSWNNPLVDRINIPGTIHDKNWTIRLRASIQDIISSKDLTALLAELSSACCIERARSLL